MAKRPERRQVARLTTPSQFSGRTLAHPPVRLVDLSLQGARIEHPDPLNAGLMCFIDFPPALGRGSLTGRVVWTKPHRHERTLEGARQRSYRSGLTWTRAHPRAARRAGGRAGAPPGRPGGPAAGTPRRDPGGGARRRRRARQGPGVRWPGRSRA